ncbi:MAG: helix-turn-helix domain-containing protein [archaeon]
MDAKILEEIGLTKSETNVYLALLELGSTTTGKIVDKSHASSSKIYEILDKLMQKGLVSFIIKSNIKYFEAAPPERIMDYLEEKEKQFQKQKQSIKSILPELHMKRELSKYKSEATVYKGVKGLETALNDIFQILGAGDIVYTFIAGDLDETLNNMFTRHYKKRAELGIKTKTIFSETGRKWYETRKEIKHFEGKVIPTESKSPATMMVYKDKTIIRIGDAKEVIAVVIDNKNCAQAFMDQFNNLWNQKIRVYESIDSIRDLFREIQNFGNYAVLAEGKNLLFQTLGKEFFSWWQNEKKLKKIQSRGITASQYKDEYQIKTSTTDFKFISKYQAPGTIFIFKDRIINIHFSKKPIAFLVENKEIANDYNKYFENLWNK